MHQPKNNLISPDMVVEMESLSWGQRLQYCQERNISMKLAAKYIKRLRKIRKTHSAGS